MPGSAEARKHWPLSDLPIADAIGLGRARLPVWKGERSVKETPCAVAEVSEAMEVVVPEAEVAVAVEVVEEEVVDGEDDAEEYFSCRSSDGESVVSSVDAWEPLPGEEVHEAEEDSDDGDSIALSYQEDHEPLLPVEEDQGESLLVRSHRRVGIRPRDAVNDDEEEEAEEYGEVIACSSFSTPVVAS
ncbi:hypothetical protein SISNIDRAFT_541218, partial [Sistotremastrum niveocremeum HHB9708]